MIIPFSNLSISCKSLSSRAVELGFEREGFGVDKEGFGGEVFLPGC